MQINQSNVHVKIAGLSNLVVGNGNCNAAILVGDATPPVTSQPCDLLIHAMKPMTMQIFCVFMTYGMCKTLKSFQTA